MSGRVNNRSYDEARILLRRALKEAQSRNNRESIAESQLLLAKTLPSSEFDERVRLIEQALEALNMMNDELRGSAKIELGLAHLRENASVFARFYVEQGRSVNEELFRKIDDAFILGALSEIEKDSGDSFRYLDSLHQAATAAEQLGEKLTAARKYRELMYELEKSGYTKMAVNYGLKSKVYYELLLKDQPDSVTAKTLKEESIEVFEKIVELELEFQGSDLTP